MLDYIKKFNNLSKELRGKVSVPAVMSAIEKLEKEYNVNLAAVVMKIMVKEEDVNKLADYFMQEFRLDKIKAEQLTKELKEKILFGVADYLGIKKEVRSNLPAGKAGKLEVRSDKAEEIVARQATIVQSVKGSDLLFLDEDEAEIKALAKHMDKNTGIALSGDEIEKQLDKTLAQAQINFGSEELTSRFRGILKIYFRGVRDRIDTKQTLIKPIDVGGLGFDQESAEQVLKITDSNKAGKALDTAPVEKVKIPKLAKEKTEDLKESGLASIQRSGVRDIDYDLASLLNKKSVAPKEKIKEQDTGEAFKKLDAKHELAPPPPMLRRTSPSTPKLRPALSSVSSGFHQDQSRGGQISPSFSASVDVSEKPGKSIEAGKESAVMPRPGVETGHKATTTPKPAQEVKQIDDRKVYEATGKIKMEDVKAKLTPQQISGAGFRPKVMGPIDELKYMGLISFRRLDKDSNSIVEKIKGKINLLEEEEYAKRFKGIKAWRASPVNQLYLEMGQASISENKPIDIIIKERKAEGKECLESKEFEAVTDLNRDLRF